MKFRASHRSSATKAAGRRSFDLARGCALAWCCALAFTAGCDSKTAGGTDFVFTGGRVFTGDSTNAWAQAIAIAGDRIVAVGTDSAITALAGPRTQRIALAGRLVIPGFNDAHAHVGAGLGGVTFHSVVGATPDPAIATVLAALKSAAKKAARNAWLVTDVGDRVLSDPKARRALIDSVVSNRPVMLRSWTGHGAVLNTAALHATGLDTAADIEGGWQERDAARKPTGRVDGYALYAVQRAIEVGRGQNPTTAGFRAYDLLSASLGITSSQIMATNFSPSMISHIEQMGALRSRQRVVPFEIPGAGRRESLWVGAKPSNMLTTISGAKWILDGTPIERLAFMRAPYADRANWRGHLNFPAETIAVLLREALAHKQQPIFHAVGDSTIATLFAVMHKVAADSTWQRVRVRLEHADALTPDLFADAKALGVVVVQNPTHLVDPDLIKRWDVERLSRTEQLRGIVEAGIPLAIGSDGEPNPFINIMLAASHPLNVTQALTREQAVKAYTSGSAYAENTERDKGLIKVGYLADIAVLSQNIFTVPLNTLPATTSVFTMVGGRVTLEALKHQSSLKIPRHFWRTPNFIRRFSRN